MKSAVEELEEKDRAAEAASQRRACFSKKCSLPG